MRLVLAIVGLMLLIAGTSIAYSITSASATASAIDLAKTQIEARLRMSEQDAANSRAAIEVRVRMTEQNIIRTEAQYVAIQNILARLEKAVESKTP